MLYTDPMSTSNHALTAASWLADLSPTEVARCQHALWGHLLKALEAGAVQHPCVAAGQAPSGQSVQWFDALLKTGERIDVVVVTSGDADPDVIRSWCAQGCLSHPHLQITHATWLNAQTGTTTSWSVADDLSSADPLDWGDDIHPVSASPASLDDLAQEFAAWRLIGQEAEAASKSIEQQMIQQAAGVSFGADGSTSYGVARMKMNKTYDVQKVDAAVVSLMSDLQFPSADVHAHYTNNPNFWVAPKMDANTLVDLVQLNFQVDVRVDPRFSDAITEERKPNMDTRLDFLKDLDASQTVDFDSLVDPSLTTFKAELIREAPTGPTRLARDAVMTGIRAHIAPLARAAGSSYAQARSHWAQATPAPKIKAVRKKRGT